MADQQLHLFGRILLFEALKSNGYHWQDVQADINYDSNRRPHFATIPFDFNISHSGIHVMCAITDTGMVGIDVEKTREVTLTDFTRVMNPDQWQIIFDDPFPTKKFFQYWTIKESVIKADGRGLQMSLPKILIGDHQVTYEDRQWYYREVPLASDYCCAVASEHFIPEIQPEIMDHKQLIQSWL